MAQVAQQKIDVQTALMRLVNDDRVVGFKKRVGLGLSQQNAVSHELDRGIAAQAVLKAHFVADNITQRCFQLFGNPLGNA